MKAFQDSGTNTPWTVKRILMTAAKSIGGIILLLILLDAIYTVEEGHVGIVKRFSEAKEQVGPGLHFKYPMVDSVEAIEVRTRRNEENMQAATSEQMPLSVTVSVNWTVEKSSAFELFVAYGGLDQFENRILDSRLKSSAKAAISKYTAEKLVTNRELVIATIAEELEKTMKAFPQVKLDSIQLDNFTLPNDYVESIKTKQKEENLADAEKFKLQRQDLEAQREVNTARANAESIELTSTAEANAIRKKGLAEGDAIEAKARALKNNPLIVQLTLAQNWDGAQPRMVTGNGGMILQLREPEDSQQQNRLASQNEALSVLESRRLMPPVSQSE